MQTTEPPPLFAPPLGDAEFSLNIDDALWRERAASIGYTGGNREDAVEHVARIIDFQLDAEKTAYQQEHQFLAERAREVLGEASTASAHESEARSQLEQIEKEEVPLTAELAGTMAELQAEGLRLAQLRLEQIGAALPIGSGIDTEEAQQLDENQHKLRDQSTEFERARYERRKQAFETNRPEFERRARQAEVEQARIEDELKRVTAILTALRETGLTLTTAGFTAWSGYASMLGASFLLVGLILARLKGTPSPIASALTAIRGRLGEIRSIQDLLWPLLQLAGLTMAALLLLLMFTCLVSWILQRGRRVANFPKRQPSERSFLAELMLPVHFVQGLFGETESNRLRMRERRQTEGSLLSGQSLRRLIGLTPYILFTALALFFGAALGLEGPAGDAQVPYIGLALAFGTTSMAILFVCSRWHAWVGAGKIAWPVAGIRHASALFAALVAVALLGCANFPNRPEFDRSAIALVALSLLLSSLSLAVGLVVKGIFRDERELADKRNLYRALIDSYRSEPTFGEEEYVEPIDLARAQEQHRVRRHMAYELAWLEQLRVRYQIDFPSENELASFIRKAADAIGSHLYLPPLRATTDPSILLAYVSAPGAFVERYGQLIVKERSLKSHVGLMAASKERLTARIERLQERVSYLRSQLTQLHAQMMRLTVSYEARCARLKAKREQITSVCEEAFLAGNENRNLGGLGDQLPLTNGETA
jgi:hypothetical protein